MRQDSGTRWRHGQGPVAVDATAAGRRTLRMHGLLRQLDFHGSELAVVDNELVVEALWDRVAWPV
jgi:hypothetical protein